MRREAAWEPEKGEKWHFTVGLIVGEPCQSPESDVRNTLQPKGRMRP